MFFKGSGHLVSAGNIEEDTIDHGLLKGTGEHFWHTMKQNLRQ